MSETVTIHDMIAYHQRELTWYLERRKVLMTAQGPQVEQYIRFHEGALVYLRWVAGDKATMPLDNNVT